MSAPTAFDAHAERFMADHGAAAWADVERLAAIIYDGAITILTDLVEQGVDPVDALHAGTYSALRSLGKVLHRDTDARIRTATARGVVRRERREART